MQSKLIRSVSFIAVLIGSLVVSVGAQATAMFSASASASFTIVSISGGTPGDLLIDGLVFDDFGASFGAATSSGSAFINATDPLDMGVGDGSTQSSSASATPSGSDGDAFWGNEVSVLFSNLGSSDITVSISVEWSAAVDASVDNLGAEDAFAFAGVDILDDTGDVDVLEEFLSDVLDPLALGPDGGSDAFSVSFVVEAGLDNELVLFTVADGFAAAVPEPTTLALMGLGLAGIGYRRHRSKKAA